MFCSNCGKAASGNFCAYCGTKIATPGEEEIFTVLPADWSHEVRYETLMRIPEVRDRIARAAASARKSLTQEDYLKLYDKAFSPAVPMAKISEIVTPLYASWGIKTGKTRSGFIPVPVGTVIVDVLCSLAHTNRTIKRVSQADDGCVVEATLPSDLMSLEGELVLSIHRVPEGTRIEAATKIPGQLYDWGKSNRCLSKLFEELGAVA
jgi:hypothetical protein